MRAVETFARVSPKDMEELKEADKMSFKSTLRSLKEVKKQSKVKRNEKLHLSMTNQTEAMPDSQAAEEDLEQ